MNLALSLESPTEDLHRLLSPKGEGPSR
jgi:hypothetical protein